MSEVANVTAPVSDKPPTTSWFLGAIHKRRYPSWLIHLEIVETYAGGTRVRDLEFTESSVPAASVLVKALNTHNNALKSEERFVMEWLVTNGYYPAVTYSGTPD